jgi:hypothetical protein
LPNRIWDAKISYTLNQENGMALKHYITPEKYTVFGSKLYLGIIVKLKPGCENGD